MYSIFKKNKQRVDGRAPALSTADGSIPLAMMVVVAVGLFASYVSLKSKRKMESLELLEAEGRMHSLNQSSLARVSTFFRINTPHCGQYAYNSDEEKTPKETCPAAYFDDYKCEDPKIVALENSRDWKFAADRGPKEYFIAENKGLADKLYLPQVFGVPHPNLPPANQAPGFDPDGMASAGHWSVSNLDYDLRRNFAVEAYENRRVFPGQKGSFLFEHSEVEFTDAGDVDQFLKSPDFNRQQGDEFTTEVSVDGFECSQSGANGFITGVYLNATTTHDSGYKKKSSTVLAPVDIPRAACAIAISPAVLPDSGNVDVMVIASGTWSKVVWPNGNTTYNDKANSILAIDPLRIQNFPVKRKKCSNQSTGPVTVTVVGIDGQSVQCSARPTFTKTWDQILAECPGEINNVNNPMNPNFVGKGGNNNPNEPSGPGQGGPGGGNGGNKNKIGKNKPIFLPGGRTIIRVRTKNGGYVGVMGKKRK